MWLAFRFSIVSWVMAAGLVLAPIGVSAWLQLKLHKQLAIALARYGNMLVECVRWSMVSVDVRLVTIGYDSSSCFRTHCADFQPDCC